MSELEVRESGFPFQGLTLRYREWFAGNSAGSSLPVVALHGWMDNAGTFDALAPQLSFPHLIALDFSGHGLSDHRSVDSDYYIWSYAEEVKTLLEHLEIGSCHLLAHSMGGAVACVFAALYPERVASLMMLDMAGPITTEAAQFVEQMRTAVAGKESIAGQAVRRYTSLEAAQQSRANKGITLQSAVALGRRGIAQDGAGWFWTVDRQLTRRHLVSLTEEHCRVLLQAIEAPVLAITAASTWDHRRDFLERRLGWFGQLRHHELDGNHFQHLEGRVEEVAAHIRTFLDSLPDQ